VSLLENIFPERVSEDPIFATFFFAPANQDGGVIWKDFAVLFMFVLVVVWGFLKDATLISLGIWWLIPIDHNGTIPEDLFLDCEFSLVLLLITLTDASFPITMRKVRAFLFSGLGLIWSAIFRDQVAIFVEESV